MDGVLRQNAGVSIGDVVKVRKANLRSAQRVTIAPVGEYIRVDPDYLKRAYLLGKPFGRVQLSRYRITRVPLDSW